MVCFLNITFSNSNEIDKNLMKSDNNDNDTRYLKVVHLNGDITKSEKKLGILKKLFCYHYA